MSNQPQYVYVQQTKAPSNGLATASMVLGIVAIVFGAWSPIPILGLIAAGTGFVPAVVAVVLGHLGLRASATNGIGRGSALTGMVLGYVTIGIVAVTTLFWIIAAIASAASSHS